MSENLVPDWNAVADPGADGQVRDTAGGARSVPVRCLLSVDPFLSRSVHEAVNGQEGRWRVCEVVDGLDAVYAAESTRFDIVVLDLRLPVLDGYSAAARICRGGGHGAGHIGGGLPPPAVLLVVDSVHELPVSPSIDGAQLRVLFRDAPAELVRSAVNWAAGMAGERAPAARGELRSEGVAPQGGQGGPDCSSAGLLSTRERQVLISLCLGQSNRQLASALSVSEATVKTHVSHLLAKLGLSSRVEAVVFAYENGIVVPGRRRRTA